MSAGATMRRAVALARVAGAARTLRRATDEDTRRAARHALAAVMADARGVPMKVGQLLAKDGADDAFRALVEGVEPLSWSQIAPHIEERLGRPIDDVFAHLNPIGVAASLGQVHEGRLVDGRHVAVKVLYPHIESAVDAELRLAGLLPSMGPVKRWGFDLAGYKQTLRANMMRELDYRDEANRQSRFRASVVVGGLVVPDVVEEPSGSKLLVQSWESGQPLRAIAGWPRVARLEVARILMTTLFRSFFVAGMTHGDPHPGNYRFRMKADAQPEVVLFDYGCTIEPDERVRLALLCWIVAVREGRPVDHLELLREMGFSADKLRPIENALPELSRVLLAPFLAPGPFAVGTWQVREQMDALLGDLRWWFRAAGPPNLLLLMRAFHGLAMQLEHLGSTLPWWPVLTHAVGHEWMRRARAYRPTGAYRASAEPVPRATLLKVRVSRTGREPLAISMPAEEARDLADLVPSDVQAQLHRQGVDLQQIQRAALASGLAPQVLFELSNDADHYRVWLE